MPELLYLTTVVFVPAHEESRCRSHLKSGEIMTIAGVTPSGKQGQFRGIIRSVKGNSLLHPGYSLMVTLAEKFPDNGG